MNKSFLSCLPVAIVVLTFVPAALANFAPRFWGDVTSEPWGIKEVRIAHEQLVIDLRPLVNGNSVQVEVTYELLNSGEPKHLDLLFVAGEMGIREFEARLGDTPVETRVLSADESRELWKRAPQSWRSPQGAPGLLREDNYYAFRGYNREPDLVALSLALPAGASTLQVRYLAHACGTDERPTVTWLLPYVLAPAREWGGFGRLDVVVYVPEGWDARSTPALDREGDTLRGSFPDLPSDSLVVATGAPVPSEYTWTVRGMWTLWFALLLGGPVMCWWTGSRMRLANAHLMGFLMRILPAVFWGALIYAAIPVSMRLVKASLHGQENPSLNYPWYTATVCLVLFIIPSAVLLGFGLTFWSASRSTSSAEMGSRIA